MTLHLLDQHDNPVGTHDVDSADEVGAAVITDNFGNRHRVDVDRIQNVSCQSCDDNAVGEHDGEPLCDRHLALAMGDHLMSLDL